ncbi:MAG: hypothetical protein Ct9H300mP1_05020 [Planctomycetaceae bacterium]|nr:MAG: hypothetical protein Ct9H300mP1_05020 [Planctomycetaceae bacterium]
MVLPFTSSGTTAPGVAFGGNKTRHNEFLIADALEKGAELVVWGAGVQSNNCRQTAAACAKAGLDIHLVLGRGKPADGPDLVQGNLLLDHLVGAHVEIIDGQVGPEVDARIAEVADEYRQAGRNVYEWDRYTVKSLAAVSYVLCLVEIIEQAREDGQLETRAGGWTPQAVYGCSGPGFPPGPAWCWQPRHWVPSTRSATWLPSSGPGTLGPTWPRSRPRPASESGSTRHSLVTTSNCSRSSWVLTTAW